MSKTKVTVSIDKELLDKAKMEATQMGLSLSAYLTLLIVKSKEVKNVFKR